MIHPPFSSPDIKGTIQVSKWMRIGALISSEELSQLLDLLGPIAFYDTTRPVQIDEMVYSKEQFLAAYETELDSLRLNVPLPANVKHILSTSLSLDPNTFYAQEVRPGKYLLRPLIPSIQMRTHQFIFAPQDRKFFSQVFSSSAIRWGLEFSYPQIYQNSLRLEHEETLKQPHCINSPLMKKIRLWMREYSKPASFLFQEHKLYAPFRIGNKVLLDNHPDLERETLTLLRN